MVIPACLLDCLFRHWAVVERCTRSRAIAKRVPRSAQSDSGGTRQASRFDSTFLSGCTPTVDINASKTNSSSNQAKRPNAALSLVERVQSDLPKADDSEGQLVTNNTVQTGPFELPAAADEFDDSATFLSPTSAYFYNDVTLPEAGRHCPRSLPQPMSTRIMMIRLATLFQCSSHR